MSFEHEYLSTWNNIIGRDYEIYKLYIKYEYECELYNRNVSNILNEGGFAIPTTPTERGAMYKNALSKLGHLESEKKRLDINYEDLLNVKREVHKLDFECLKGEYDRLIKDF